MSKHTTLWTIALVVTLVAAVYQRVDGAELPRARDRDARRPDLRPSGRAHARDDLGPGDCPFAFPTRSSRAKSAGAAFRAPRRTTSCPSTGTATCSRRRSPSSPRPASSSSRSSCGAASSSSSSRRARPSPASRIPSRSGCSSRTSSRCSRRCCCRHGPASPPSRAGAWGSMRGMTLVFLVAGGFVLGPIVQHQAFGAYWTGIPFGFDLTDNKVLIALVAWGVAAGDGDAARRTPGRRRRGDCDDAGLQRTVWGSRSSWTSCPAERDEPCWLAARARRLRSLPARPGRAGAAREERRGARPRKRPSRVWGGAPRKLEAEFLRPTPEGRAADAEQFGCLLGWKVLQGILQRGALRRARRSFRLHVVPPELSKSPSVHAGDASSTCRWRELPTCGMARPARVALLGGPRRLE